LYIRGGGGKKRGKRKICRCGGVKKKTFRLATQKEKENKCRCDILLKTEKGGKGRKEKNQNMAMSER